MDRTGKLISNFKQVSMDQQTEQKRLFNVSEYINDLLQGMKNDLESKKIEVVNIIDNELEINSYPGVIAMVFTNLVRNSIIHGFETDQANRIEIKASIAPIELD